MSFRVEHEPEDPIGAQLNRELEYHAQPDDDKERKDEWDR